MSEASVHKHIERMLKRCNLPPFEELDENWQLFCQRISKSYDEMEVSQKRLNHALELSSTEMRELYDRLEKENESLEHKVQERTQELRLAMEEAKAADAAKSRFLANMSHEIRTPMNGILSAADLLTQENLNPIQLDLAQIIGRSASALLHILNDILDLSKIQNGKLTTEEIPFSSQNFFEDIVHLFRKPTEDKGLVFHYISHGEMHPYYKGDPHRLRQIIVNLLSNATKFTHHGSVILSVHVQDLGNRQQLHIEIKDTGIGIPAHKLESVFDEFTQADESTTREYGGTGLGLSITRSICQLLGIKLTLKSEVGHGTTFGLEFELDKSQAPHSKNAAKVLWTGSRKVLLVDDNSINRKMSQKILEKLNLEIEVAENGAIAVQKALNTRFDIILMDIHMPVLGGLEATHEIRKTYSALELPIIALTANILAEDHRAYMAGGMNTCLTKPFTHENLVLLLNEFLV